MYDMSHVCRQQFTLTVKSADMCSVFSQQNHWVWTEGGNPSGWDQSLMIPVHLIFLPLLCIKTICDKQRR